ncbi:exonuclease domain-containing protein [Williamsia sp.]|uniref:3'-5' exonuclease n=1 Tax=Williamsia sp. TaxID=1872085 RepID=UPI002F92C217
MPTICDLVFLDTETTGLSITGDDIWEFAAIRRHPDGTETELHLFIEHNVNKMRKQPESFRDDHAARYDYRTAVPRGDAAATIAEFLQDKPLIVGAVPNFDTERLAYLLGEFGWAPPWNYHLLDVETLAVGWITAARRAGYDFPPLTLPWRSDELAAACGVEPPATGERHTAKGDARWVKRWYDVVMFNA